MKRIAWIVVPALVLAASCSQKQQAPAAQQKTLHEIMKTEVDPRGDDVWKIGNAHIDKNAGLDGASMTDADWTKLAGAAANLKQAALELASLKDPIVVVKPGSKIAYEDTSWGDSAKSVQHNVDQDPQGVHDLANALAQQMDDLGAAAKKHDAAAAGKLIDGLDGVCESCHVKYWYPSQKALIESIKKTSGTDPST